MFSYKKRKIILLNLLYFPILFNFFMKNIRIMYLIMNMIKMIKLKFKHDMQFLFIDI